MTDTLASLNSLTAVEIDFSWTPAGTYTFTDVDGHMHTSPSAQTLNPVSFTATARVDSQGADLSGPLTIVEYHWDFGDGTFGYGQSAAHTYMIANFQLSTKLRVTDSRGRQWFTRHQMYLTSGSTIGGGGEGFGGNPFADPPFGH